METKKSFFTIWNPEKFPFGIQGKTVIQYFSSFYCKEVKCPHFAQCTKDSRPFDAICPLYIERGMTLYNEPYYSAGEETAHRKIEKVFADLLPADEWLWNYCGFSNYVQHFLPARRMANGKTRFAQTRPEDLSEDDFLAFMEVIDDLRPDVVFVYGEVVCRHVANHLVGEDAYPQAEMKEKGIAVLEIRHPVPFTLVLVTHPSSAKWYSVKENIKITIYQLFKSKSK